MPELRGLLKNNDRALYGRRERALSDLMHLSIVLEPAGHYRREWPLKSIISTLLSLRSNRCEPDTIL